ncbi:MAG TPA: hypothetical protein VG297_16630 [Bryobacteraceae bacterium]|jgi:hypothetical protein|nr:hypothetical protein [Bryobacteraceae bacterium]
MNPLVRVEELITQIDTAADPSVRAAARELVQALMDFHGHAVARMMEMLDGPVAQSMGRDEIVRPLLLLYDLHPESAEVRLRRALDRIRGVEFETLDGLAVTVRVTGGHPPGREEIEAAILDAAPEIQVVRIEGLKTPDFIPLEKLQTV